MGSCCSQSNNGDPNLTIDQRTVNDPILGRGDLASDFRKDLTIPPAPLLGNTDITFQKIEVSNSSSSINNLNEMMKTDDENIDDNEEIETDNDDDFEEEDKNQD